MTHRVKTEASRVIDVLEDILEQIYSNLHNIQKNLRFWESRAEVSKSALLQLILSFIRKEAFYKKCFLSFSKLKQSLVIDTIVLSSYI